MSNGFGREKAADRRLSQSMKELKQIREVLKKYPNDHKGRKKMLKQLKKYWRSPLGELERISIQPMSAEDYVFEPVTEPVVAEDKPEDDQDTLSEEDKQLLLDALRKKK